MASHSYDCRICGRHRELHRCISACRECREKHNIPDFEPTPDEQVKIILTIAAYVAIIAAIIVSAVKLFNWIFS